MAGADYRNFHIILPEFCSSLYPEKTNIQLLGEKTRNLMSLDIIDQCIRIPKIVIVRNPIAIWGSKKERFLKKHDC